jgi:hypothetical protein
MHTMKESVTHLDCLVSIMKTYGIKLCYHIIGIGRL